MPHFNLNEGRMVQDICRDIVNSEVEECLEQLKDSMNECIGNLDTALEIRQLLTVIKMRQDYYGLEGGYLVWDKLNGLTDQYDCELAWLSFTKRTDLVYYMWSGMIQGETPSRDVRKALRQIGNKSLNEKRVHPTQKPIKLYEWLLNEYAKEGDKILDTHLGSGSNRIACYRNGFDFVGFELDKDYYEAQEKRFKTELMQPRLF